jgi:hypothetical protein
MDTVTRLRRQRDVLAALEKLDLDAPDLRARIELLKKRATLALQQTKLGPGNPVNLADARKAAKIAHKRKGKMTANRVMPIIKELRAKRFKTYVALADELNRLGVRPPAAKKWSGATVYAVVNRGTK